MKKILLVGLTYSGKKVAETKIDTLGLCRPEVDDERAAFPLYEYDTIVINPASYSHFLFGHETEHSKSDFELQALKSFQDSYDLDRAFDYDDRCREMKAALEAGANVVWCLAEQKRHNFFGYRDTYIGYLDPRVAKFLKQSSLHRKKGRELGKIREHNPFETYFEELSQIGWRFCLGDYDDADEFRSIVDTPEGYSLGGRFEKGTTAGWIVSPPTSQDSMNKLIKNAMSLEVGAGKIDKYHSIFLSHTAADKPFVRQLRTDLMARGVEHVWVDEAEIEIGDSLTKKISEGMERSRYIAVVLSKKSIAAPWVEKELDIAMNREITEKEVVVLPLMYEACKLPKFLEGKMYADFTDPSLYQDMLAKLVRRLRIK